MRSTIRTSLARAAAGRTVAVLAVAVSLLGCSASGADEAPVTVTSDSGALRVTVQMSPEPVQRGTSSAKVTITDIGDGGTVDGLTLAVTPWMPAMDHGTSGIPVVTPLGGGVYQVSNLVLYMAGHWELRMAIGSAPMDHAAPAFDVP
jgi:hypothetical protein